MVLLYESIIDAKQRHRLGEYYTPDWLAQRIVREVVTEPLTTRVADVSCGSGTFLFHSIRHHLAAADAGGLSNSEAVRSVVDHVIGIDVHPVAATLARVTYLLAIGTDRIAGDYERFAVPVYIGDAVQWRHEHSLLTEGQVAVRTSEEGNLLSEELRFPEAILADAGRFDRLVADLAERATREDRAEGTVPTINVLLDGYDLTATDRHLIEETFRHLCRLQDEGRDHIWGYYVRNLVRPAWLNAPDHRVDALVGNPPWLSYRYMTQAMQGAFRDLSKERGLWASAKVATHQDLSALFVARAVELYLRQGGRFGYVMPEAVLSRFAYAGFRTGEWHSGKAEVQTSFDQPWSPGRIKPSVFRVPSCVVLGSAAPQAAAPMPVAARGWSGRLPPTNATWEKATHTLESSELDIASLDEELESTSDYHSDFTQGAIIVPRMLFMVDEAPAVGMLGTAGEQRRVTSARSSQEKPPWKPSEEPDRSRRAPIRISRASG